MTSVQVGTRNPKRQIQSDANVGRDRVGAPRLRVGGEADIVPLTASPQITSMCRTDARRIGARGAHSRKFCDISGVARLGISGFGYSAGAAKGQNQPRHLLAAAEDALQHLEFSLRKGKADLFLYSEYPLSPFSSPRLIWIQAHDLAPPAAEWGPGNHRTPLSSGARCRGGALAGHSHHGWSRSRRRADRRINKSSARPEG